MNLNVENEAISETGGGGAIYMTMGSLDIIDSKFIGNSAVIGGGAIYMYEASCNIKNSVFELNKANNGSCFMLNHHSSIYAENTEFSYNVADYGSIGYMKNYTCQKITLLNCTSMTDSENDAIYIE